MAYSDLFWERTTCRSCGSSEFREILSLGDQYVSDFVLEEGGALAPLDLVLCAPASGGCGLLQLRHTVRREFLYRQYWYKSGVNETMREHLAGIVDTATEMEDLQGSDIVLDIGANDGTLLRQYERGIFTIGFEPANNLVEEARVGTSLIINDFFSYETWKEKMGDKKAKVITAVAMFYDLEDPNAFVRDLARTLANPGTCIIQQNYLPTMLQKNAFDNIGHEHLEYYSLMSLEPLLRRHGLQVFHVELNDINGGSFRVYVQHNHKATGESVYELRGREEKIGLGRTGPYHEFAERIHRMAGDLRKFISVEVRRGKTIYAYGAGNRGNTLLQYYGLNEKLITAAAERNPDKWGRWTIGTNIPIISEEQAREAFPDYFLILPWAFVDTFAEREKEYLEKGGKFIVPLPEFHLREA